MIERVCEISISENNRRLLCRLVVAILKQKAIINRLET